MNAARLRADPTRPAEPSVKGWMTMINDVISAPTFDLASLRFARGRHVAAPPSGDHAAARGPRNVDSVAIDTPKHVAGDGVRTGVRTGVPDTLADLLERLPEEVRDEVRKYATGEVAADHYSPQNTADRIVRFALSGFERFDGGAAAEEGTAESRQRFVDFILPAIDRGYQEALDLLGDLAEPVAASLQETRDIIGEQLDAFAGSTPVDVEA